MIDIDNTLTTMDYTLHRLCEFFDKEVPLEQVTSFELGERFDASPEEQAEFWKTCEPDIARESRLNEHVHDYIRSHTRDSDMLHVVTARGGHLYEETYDWLERHNIFYHELHCIGKRLSKFDWSAEQNITYDVVVEDNPSYLELLPTTVRKVVVDYPYNRHVEADVRLS